MRDVVLYLKLSVILHIWTIPRDDGILGLAYKVCSSVYALNQPQWYLDLKVGGLNPSQVIPTFN